VENRPHFGISANGFKDSVNTTQEVLAKTGTAALVPSECVIHVLLGLWGNDQLSAHTGYESFV
jgi:hypothetical protein